MKKGVKPDGKELKMGSYKLLTGAERLLALDRNLSALMNQNRKGGKFAVKNGIRCLHS